MLISTETPFNKLVRDELGRNLDILKIARDFFGDRKPRFTDYRTGWSKFLDDENADWLFANHPEESTDGQFTKHEIQWHVEQLLAKRKRVVFFESGQEFLEAGRLLTPRQQRARKPRDCDSYRF